jgi:tRNA G18 (ribose-2'-O)-methylase SpoU
VPAGCVDVWEPKVVKAAHGSHFFIGLHADCDWSDISALLAATEHNCRVFVCDAATTDRTDGLPDVNNYSTLTYTDHVVLIVGGETEGISSMAYQFCRSRNGVRVHIPMAAVIDSLNCAVSVGIVLNEIRRQLMHARV